MKIKKVKRKCGMRGCKCTDSYALSLTNEMGNSIIVCKNCLEKALDAIDNYKEDATTVKKALCEAPALFFNAKAMGKKSKPLPEAEPLVNEDKQAEEAVVEALEEGVEDTEKTSVSKQKKASKKKTNKKE